MCTTQPQTPQNAVETLRREKNMLQEKLTDMSIVAFHKICSFCSQKLFNTSQVSKGTLPLSLSCSESHFHELIKMGLQILFWKI